MNLPTPIKRAAAAALLSAGACAGCATQSVPPADDHLFAAGHVQGLAPEAIVRGRYVLVTDCAKCHHPIAPNSLPAARWDEAFPRMIIKAGLSPQKTDDLRAFVAAVRAQATGPG